MLAYRLLLRTFPLLAGLFLVALASDPPACSNGGVVVNGTCACPDNTWGVYCVSPISCNHESAPLRPGLLTTVYDDSNFQEVKGFYTTQQVDFNFGYSTPPLFITSPDYFAFVIEGYLYAPWSGEYTFGASGDDQVFVYLDGTQIISYNYGNTRVYAQQNLTAGHLYRFKTEFIEFSGAASFDVNWRPPNVTVDESIPLDVLYHSTTCSERCIHGCCEGQNACNCDVGWTGPTCNISTSTCVSANTSASVPLVSAGILISYFSTTVQQTPANLLLQRVESTLYRSTTYGAVYPGGPSDFFSWAAEGFLTVNTTGWYSLQVAASSYIDLYLAGVRIFDSVSSSRTRDMFLVGSRPYSIAAKYYETTSAVSWSLKWREPGETTYVLVPATAYSHYYTFGANCPCPQGISYDSAFVCSGYGLCSNGVCLCDPEREGVACENVVCRTDSCSGNDNCFPLMNATNSAAPSHVVINATSVSSLSSYYTCSGRGVCDNGRCTCDAGLTHASACAQTAVCYGDGSCSGHGSCTAHGCVCDPGYSGTNCHLTVCNASRAIVPGLIATYYDGSQFDRIVTRHAVPHVSWNAAYGDLLQELPSNYWSIEYAGLLRPWISAEYNIRCRFDGFTCKIFLDGTLIESSSVVVNLTANVDYRLKIEYRDLSQYAEAFFEWRAVAVPAADFSLIPSDNLMRVVSCDTPCVHGCCEEDNVCTCEAGWVGAYCDQPVDACSSVLPGDTTPAWGGLRARYFNDLSLSALAVERVDPIIDWGYNSPTSGHVQSNSYRSVSWDGYVLSNNVSGWYTFFAAGDGDRGTLYVNNVKVITSTDATQRQVYLQANRLYAIRFIVLASSRFYGARLEWEPPGSVRTILPAENLYHYSGVCACAIDAVSQEPCGGEARGQCLNGFCYCNPDYYGDTCQSQQCNGFECHGSDDCFFSKMNALGATSLNDLSSRTITCNGLGTCVNGVCTDCAIATRDVNAACVLTGCPGDGLCSNNGQCLNGTCVCDSTHSGSDCQYDICKADQSLNAGLILTWYEGGEFQDIAFVETVPIIRSIWSYNNPPGITTTAFGIIADGFLRPFVTGYYRLVADDSNDSSNSDIYLNGTLLTDTTDVYLERNVNIRFKMVFLDLSSWSQLNLVWRLPNATVFTQIPEESFVHESICSSCVNGCCRRDNVCVCKPGWGGQDCSMALNECPGMSNGGQPKMGGLTGRYYSDNTFTNLVMERVDKQVLQEISSGNRHPSGLYTGGYSTVWEGLIVPHVTGWHNLTVVTVDSYARLYLQQSLFFPRGSGTVGRYVYLYAGEPVPIRLEHFDGSCCSSSISFEWSQPNLYREVLSGVHGDLMYYTGHCACPVGPQLTEECSTSVRGTCLSTTATCECDSSFHGDACQLRSCTASTCVHTDKCHRPDRGSTDAMCNGNGVCGDGVCMCDFGYAPATECATQGCPGDQQCSGNGYCSSICQCGTKFEGIDCAISVCGNDTATFPGLIARYFSNGVQDRFWVLPSMEVPIQAIDFTSFSSPPRAGVGTAGFAVVITGVLRPLSVASGAYYFQCLHSGTSCLVFLDGVRVDLDSTPVNITLSGRHRLKVEHEEGSSTASLILQWKSADAHGSPSTYTTIPTSEYLYDVVCENGCGDHGCCVGLNLCQCSPGWLGERCDIPISSDNCPGLITTQLHVGQGLLGRYFSDTTQTQLVATRIDPLVSFVWAYNGPLSGMASNYFSVVWDGFLLAPSSGWYTFSLDVEPYGSLWIAGTALLRDARDGVYSVPMYLTGGRYYSIHLHYYDTTAYADVKLSWTPPGSQSQLIPTEQFSTYDAACTCLNDCSRAVGSAADCLATLGVCSCQMSETGDDCSQHACYSPGCIATDDCYEPAVTGSFESSCGGPNGQCNTTAGVCQCSPAYTSVSDCLEPCPATCALGCSNVDGCVCPHGKYGLHCQFDTCPKTGGVVPGSRAIFYQDTAASVLAGVASRPEFGISTFYQSGVPFTLLSSSSVFSAHYSALLRADGVYDVRVVTGRPQFILFVDNVTLAVSTSTATSKTVELAAPLTFNISQPVSMELQCTKTRSGTSSCYLEWRRTNSSDAWASIPDESFEHTVTCPSGCNGAGCCIDDNVCACDIGSQGTNCTISCQPQDFTVSSGLLGVYYDNSDFTNEAFTRVDTSISFNWAYNAPSSSMGSDHFSIRWTGVFVAAPISGWYFFQAYGDRSTTIYLDSRFILSCVSTTCEERVYLRAGSTHSLIIDFVHTTYYADLSVWWQPPGGSLERLTQNNLLYYAPVNASQVASCEPSAACLPGGTSDCLSSDPCLAGTCDAISGRCTFIYTTSSCDDNDPCTVQDTCYRGTCAGSAMNCYDANSCTDDTCINGTCVHTNNTAPCSDLSSCTIGDTCGNGTCHAGTPRVCTTSNPCKTASCDAQAGCVYTDVADGLVCNDDSACTYDDICSAGVCVGSLVVCDDGNQCTDDSCVSSTGCVFANRVGLCNDNDTCTVDDTCVAGVCAGTLACGCAGQPDGTSCSDLDRCTVGDVCVNETCVSGSEALVCNDGNVCTSDRCDVNAGCVYTANNTAPCDDNSVCTTSDRCLEGSCVGDRVSCLQDTNPCTFNSCDPLQGCLVVNTASVCDDRNPCTTSDRCSGGVCVGYSSCSGHGSCATDGTCECSQETAGQWTGPTCSTFLDAPAFTFHPEPLRVPENRLLVTGPPTMTRGLGPFTFAILSGVASPPPTSMSVNVSTGVIQWQAGAALDVPINVTMQASNAVGAYERTLSIYVVPSYNVTVLSVSTSILKTGEVVTISGEARDVETRALQQNKAVQFVVSVRGAVLRVDAVTDSNGMAIGSLGVPLAGYCAVGARHPGDSAPVSEQDSFQVVDARLEDVPSRVDTHDATTIALRLRLRNLGDLPLNGLSLVPVVLSAPVNSLQMHTNYSVVPNNTVVDIFIVMEIGSVSELLSRLVIGEIQLSYSISVQFVFIVDISPQRVQLRIAPTQLRVGAVAGNQTVATFTLHNDGQLAGHDLRAVIQPEASSWIRVASPTLPEYTFQTGPVIAARSSIPVTLLLEPTIDGGLGTFTTYIGLVTSETSVSFPVIVSVTSSRRGFLEVYVEDENTYWDAAGLYPRVANATVTLRDPQSTSVVYHRMLTNANGTAVFADILEGYYQMRVEAENHLQVAEVIFVETGPHTTKTVFIEQSAVEYTWSVTPVTVSDHYRITVEATFKTRVPYPVITMDPPGLNMTDIVIRRPPSIQFNVTNHGLISVNDMSLAIPTEVEGIKLTPLVPVDPIAGLAGLTSLIVPYLIEYPGEQPDDLPSSSTATYDAPSTVAPDAVTYSTVDVADAYSTAALEALEASSTPGGMANNQPQSSFIYGVNETPAIEAVETTQGVAGGATSTALTTATATATETGVGVPTPPTTNPPTGGGVTGGGVTAYGSCRSYVVRLRWWLLCGYQRWYSRSYTVETFSARGTCIYRARAYGYSSSCCAGGWAVYRGGSLSHCNPCFAYSGLIIGCARTWVFPSGVGWGIGIYGWWHTMNFRAATVYRVMWDTTFLVFRARYVVPWIPRCYSIIRCLRRIVYTGCPRVGLYYSAYVGRRREAAVGYLEELSAMAQKQSLAPFLSTPTEETLARLRRSEGVSGADIETALNAFLDQVKIVDEMMKVIQVVFNDEAWFTDLTEDFRSNWTTAVAAPSDEGVFVSPAELVTLVNPEILGELTTLQVETWVARWNRTQQYWASGVLRKQDVANGDSTDFIAQDEMATAADEYRTNALDPLLNQGYQGPFDGWVARFADLETVQNAPKLAGTCATVKIRLTQEAVIARSAFEAVLELDNNDDGELTDFGVTLSIRAENEAEGSSQNERFFIPDPVVEGFQKGVTGNGTLASKGHGVVTWLIRPTHDSAPEFSVFYSFGGTMTYTINGQAVSITLIPETIEVFPEPLLRLDYFWQRHVYSDDPFTAVVEPAMPFSVAVMVHNYGNGTLLDMNITSAQPEIVENDEKGLVVTFAILGAQVAGEEVKPSLQVQLGDIAPQERVVARWLMASSLNGEFIQFNATFEHTSALGDPRLSVIDSVEVHDLIHAVRVVEPRDDNLPDFLVNEIPDVLDAPDTIYSSDGRILRVAAGFSPSSNLVSLGNGSIVAHLVVGPEQTGAGTGYTYTRVESPWFVELSNRRRNVPASTAQTDYVVSSANSSTDGNLFAGENVWETDRTTHFLDGSNIRERVLHILSFGDLNQTISVVFDPVEVVRRCNSIECLNNGTCIDEIDGYLCLCTTDYHGDVCEHSIDCDSSPCANGGTCSESGSSYSCGCPIGFAGQQCEHPDYCLSYPCHGVATCVNNATTFHCIYPVLDECASSPCQNGATCTEGAQFGYTCTCAGGYTGVQCGEDIDECASFPCLNGATCANMVNNHLCLCIDGFVGVLCESEVLECASSPCVSGGTCTELQGGYTCACVAGRTGLACENDIIECASTPCLNGATCVDGNNQFTCVCAASFSGVLCETQLEECFSSPCLNGGICVMDVGGAASYTCSCNALYTGATCETHLDVCASEPCANGGTCFEDVGAGALCTCVAGYSGSACESNIDECASSGCQHGATCVDLVDGFSCLCATGFAGVVCETDIDECVSAPCLNGGVCSDAPGRFNCACPLGYFGDSCEGDHDYCASSPCLNNGACTDHVTNFTCSCASGYAGVTCETDVDECASAPCANGATCTDGVATFVCVCANGFVGDVCSEVDECASSPCENGATCTDADGEFMCGCIEGFNGATCGTNIDECASSPCASGGTCMDEIASHSCVCASGFTGDVCETNIDECASSPCQSGGVCSDGSNGYVCACASGFFGLACEGTTDFCASAACESGSTCVNEVAGFRCVCPVGYEGTLCETNTDECASSPCASGGTCVDEIGSYSCVCADGFTGDVCETNIDECASSACQNGGTCVDGTAGYVCTCVSGFYGLHCEGTTDFCAASPCLNAGTCVNQIADYRCVCSAGRTGSECGSDIDECASSPCQNGATCSEGTTGTYSCGCVAGYEGVQCETNTDECASVPCLNGATCTDGVDAFVCGCAGGFTGMMCETPGPIPCSSNPCRNSGTCANNGVSFRCMCASGFEGTQCERNTNECASSPCQNGGTCSDGIASFACACTAGFVGAHCTTPVSSPCGSQPCSNGATCVESGSAFSCVCIAPWTGAFCDVLVGNCTPGSDPCSNGGECRASTNGVVCVCDPGFTGAICDEVVGSCGSLAPCANGGTCLDVGLNVVECACPSGFTGPSCEDTTSGGCASAPCLNRGSCTSLSSSTYLCACPLGFTGRVCESDIDECATTPCANGGTCTQPTSNSFSCICPSGFTGATCATLVGSCQPTNQCQDGVSFCREDSSSGTYTCECIQGVTGTLCDVVSGTCDADPCDSGATCVPLNADTVNCTCPAGTTGLTCSHIVTDECASNPCQAQGSCVLLTGGGFECRCLPGDAGALCEQRVDECASSPCALGSTCVDGTAGFTCSCPAGHTGDLCNEHIGDCVSNTCASTGLCVAMGTTVRCVCDAGFTGADCSKIVAKNCTLADAANACANGGNCQDLGVAGGLVCVCPAGFTGADCGQSTTGVCSSSPCSNRGTCAEVSGAVSCTCATGFAGATCDDVIDLCASSPCANGGVCLGGVGTYTCACPTGATGVKCSLIVGTCNPSPCSSSAQCRAVANTGAVECVCDSLFSGGRCETVLGNCSTNPCQNGGVCEPTAFVGSVTCNCTAEFTGPACGDSTSGPCASSPCLNRGSCMTTSGGDFACACPTSHVGAQCETNVNECASSPCLNGGTCRDGTNSYVCVCVSPYYGTHCDDFNVVGGSDVPADESSPMLIVVIAALCIVLLLVLLFLVVRRRRQVRLESRSKQYHVASLSSSGSLSKDAMKQLLGASSSTLLEDPGTFEMMERGRISNAYEDAPRPFDVANAGYEGTGEIRLGVESGAYTGLPSSDLSATAESNAYVSGDNGVASTASFSTLDSTAYVPANDSSPPPVALARIESDFGAPPRLPPSRNGATRTEESLLYDTVPEDTERSSQTYSSTPGVHHESGAYSSATGSQHESIAYSENGAFLSREAGVYAPMAAEGVEHDNIFYRNTGVSVSLQNSSYGSVPTGRAHTSITSEGPDIVRDEENSRYAPVTVEDDSSKKLKYSPRQIQKLQAENPA